MRRFLNIALLSVLSVLVAGPSFAQAVAFSGKLQIGFGDQDNATGFRSNNAVPICAGQGPLVNPGTVGTTLGTLLMNGTATAAPGVGGTVTFQGVQAGAGGAQQKVQSTCNVAIPGFANPRLRSRTQIGAAQYPGRKGAFTTMLSTATVPTVAPTYMLSAAGGNEQATTGGGAYEASIPFFGLGQGVQRVNPGAARFGGAMPFSGGGAVQLGVNFQTLVPGGTSMEILEPGDYGLVLYANGLLPTSPQIFGTDATGVNIINPVTGTIYTPSFTYTAGIVNGRQDNQYAARTPGGTTKDQQGAVRTVLGGNTVTPAPGGPATQIVSPVAFTGVFGEWTTGMVTHTDMVGDFTTIRMATGFDRVPATTGTADDARAANAGATRRLQVVSPWAATIRPVGPFGLPVPNLGFGGIASMQVDIIPAPEPGTIAMLGFGALGLVGLSASRRRNG
ncbi:MAG: PEP-CTERM sorting domain-containing protein [bacterium]|nr:PEP-CTERM sorting domain-containing protein [bacterium]